MRKNADQNNTEYGHFLCNVYKLIHWIINIWAIKIFYKISIRVSNYCLQDIGIIKEVSLKKISRPFLYADVHLLCYIYSFTSETPVEILQIKLQKQSPEVFYKKRCS